MSAKSLSTGARLRSLWTCSWSASARGLEGEDQYHRVTILPVALDVIRLAVACTRAAVALLRRGFF